MANSVARNVDALAVDLDVTVVDELASLRTGRSPSGAVHHVVEAQLKETEHVLTGNAGATVCFVVDVAELAFAQAVGETCLLLFLQLEQVFTDVAAATGLAVIARWVWALVESDRLALGAPDVGAEATGNACLWSGVTRHVSDPPTLCWTAAVMRNGGDVFDSGDFNSCVGDGPDCGLTA